VISSGRMELGVGAGWMRSEYEAAGIAYEPAGIRRERLEEAVTVIKGLFGPDPLDFTGRHYTIRKLDGLPKPTQKPHPPVAIGGGGPRMLQMAGRLADIAGIYANLGQGTKAIHPIFDLGPDRVAEKVAFVRDGAHAAGRDGDEIELEISLLLCRVVQSASEGDRVVEHAAAAWGATPAAVAASPAVLVGTVEHCAELLQERRERYGISYIHVGLEFGGAAPLVARLSGK